MHRKVIYKSISRVFLNLQHKTDGFERTKRCRSPMNAVIGPVGLKIGMGHAEKSAWLIPETP